MKATQDFTHAGISVREGEEVAPLTFEADEVQMLIAAGLLIDGEPAKKEPDPKPKAVPQAAGKVKAAAKKEGSK
jgi:hypothetical protein